MSAGGQGTRSHTRKRTCSQNIKVHDIADTVTNSNTSGPQPKKAKRMPPRSQASTKTKTSAEAPGSQRSGRQTSKPALTQSGDHVDPNDYTYPFESKPKGTIIFLREEAPSCLISTKEVIAASAEGAAKATKEVSSHKHGEEGPISPGSASITSSELLKLFRPRNE